MSPDPAFERRVLAVLARMPVPPTASGHARREARVRAVLAEADRAAAFTPFRSAAGRDHQAEWPEPEGAFGLSRDLPCLAAAIRGTS